MSKDKLSGEGDKEADRRYREAAKKSAEKTSEKERAENARRLSDEEKRAARNAEDKGKSRARS